MMGHAIAGLNRWTRDGTPCGTFGQTNKAFLKRSKEHRQYAKSKTSTFKDSRSKTPHPLQGDCGGNIGMSELPYSEAPPSCLPELWVLQRTDYHGSQESLIRRASHPRPFVLPRLLGFADSSRNLVESQRLKHTYRD